MFKKREWFPYWLTGLSFVGLVMMFWSTGQKIHYLNDPSQKLNCTLNPILDCGKVITHDLSSVFNVSNSMIGMVFFSALFALGVALMLGARFNRRVHQLIVALVVIMLLFASWFYAVSLYVIGKVCIFCAGVWVAVFPLAALTLRQYDRDIFDKSKRFKQVREVIQNHPDRITLILYALAIVLFLYRFRDYYFG